MTRNIKYIIPLFFLCSCFQKQTNEISEMTLECFKAGKSITIHFIPHPMDKEPIDDPKNEK